MIVDSKSARYGLKAVGSDPFEVAGEIRDIVHSTFYLEFLKIFERAAEVPQGSTWSEVFTGTSTLHGMDNSEVIPRSRLIQKVWNLILENEYMGNEFSLNCEFHILPSGDGDGLLIAPGYSAAKIYSDVLIESGLASSFGINTAVNSGLDLEEVKHAWLTDLANRSNMSVSVGTPTLRSALDYLEEAGLWSWFGPKIMEMKAA